MQQLSLQCKYDHFYCITGSKVAFTIRFIQFSPGPPSARLCSVYLEVAVGRRTSHGCVVWTQEANWSYRRQTRKAVLAVR